MARRSIRRALAAAMVWFAVMGSGVAQAAPAPVTITFDDDPAPGTTITCNPDQGYAVECAPAHHAWLRGKGIDVAGAPNGHVWATRLEGPLSRRRVGIGYVSPGWSDRDGGLSANEAVAFRFLNAYSSRIEVELAVIPTNDPLVNNRPARVIAYGLDERCQAVAHSSLQFTGVTRGRLTPGRLTVVAPRMGTVLLQVEDHPFGGVFVQSIRTTPVQGPAPSAATPCDPSQPIRPAEPTPPATATPTRTPAVRRTATPRATATTPRRTTTARPTTPRATATPVPISSTAAACLTALAAPVQSTRSIGEGVADLAEAADCLDRRGEAPASWQGQLLVSFNGVQRHVVRGDRDSTGRMLRIAIDQLNRLRQRDREHAAAAVALRDATERLRVRVHDPSTGPL